MVSTLVSSSCRQQYAHILSILTIRQIGIYSTEISLLKKNTGDRIIRQPQLTQKNRNPMHQLFRFDFII